MNDPTRRYVLYKDEDGMEEEHSFLSNICGSQQTKTKKDNEQEPIFAKKSIFQSHPEPTTSLLPHNRLVFGHNNQEEDGDSEEEPPVSPTQIVNNGGLFGVCFVYLFFSP